MSPGSDLRDRFPPPSLQPWISKEWRAKGDGSQFFDFAKMKSKSIYSNLENINNLR